MRDSVRALALFCILPLLAACSLFPSRAQPTSLPTPAEVANMPNPASVFCEEQGGTVDIRTGADGGQTGVCVFADGSECDEWTFFRGECAPGANATAAESPGYLPDAAALAAFDYEGWLTYSNPTHGFDVRYPATWELEETTDPADTMAGHRIDVRPSTDSAVVLFIAYKDADDDRRITPTGIGAGDLVARGGIPFFGEALRREALVLNGKDTGVLYGGGGEIPRGDLVFWIDLHYTGNPATDPGLSADVEALADQVITSLEITQ